MNGVKWTMNGDFMIVIMRYMLDQMSISFLYQKQCLFLWKEETAQRWFERRLSDQREFRFRIIEALKK